MKIIKVNNGKISRSQIDQVVKVLSCGGVIIYPTETIYGFGCNVFNESAVDKIFRIKGRGKKNVASVMLAEKENIGLYAQVGELDKKFLDKYLPGPVTVILNLREEIKKQNIFSEKTVNENGGVGFRVAPTSFPCLKQVMQKCDFPILSTSANKSGVGVQLGTLDYVKKQIGNEFNEVDLILDAGDLNNITPSTVVDLTKTPYTVIRWGMEKIDPLDLESKTL